MFNISFSVMESYLAVLCLIWESIGHITLSWWDFRGILFEEDICQQHIMMVQFLLLSSCHQWLLMGQKLQAAFLSAGKKRQGHTGKYWQLIKFFKLQRKLFSRGHQASPAPLCVMDCIWSQQGEQLLTVSGNRASVCGLNSKMLSELQTDFLQPKLQDSLVWCLKVSPNYSIWNSLSSQAKGNNYSKTI